MEEHYYTDNFQQKKEEEENINSCSKIIFFQLPKFRYNIEKPKIKNLNLNSIRKGGKKKGMGMRWVRSARGGTWRGWGCRCGGEGRRRCGGGSWPQGWGGGRCCSGTPPPSTWSPSPPLPASRGSPPAPTAPPSPPPSPPLVGILHHCRRRRPRRSRLLGRPRAATRPPKLKLVETVGFLVSRPRHKHAMCGNESNIAFIQLRRVGRVESSSLIFCPCTSNPEELTDQDIHMAFAETS